MRSGTSPTLPPNRRLRRTVARLLLTVPTLSLTGCQGDDFVPGTYCYDYTATVTIDTTPEDGGIITGLDCLAICHTQKPETTACREGSTGVTYADGGTQVRTYVACDYPSRTCTYVDGRQPEGLMAARVKAPSALGALFAELAWLESASVPAFLRLADELKAHGAPEALIRAAQRSAGDEVRHTRAMEALARRHGAPMPEVEIAPFSQRSLEAMVLENAREGCVREMYGAVVAGWQARTAQDAQVRAELARIAEDELRHAELAWAVDAWAAERLTPAEYQRVREARLEAFQELERAVAQEQPEAVLVQQAGLPSRDSALRLLRGLQVLVA
jgi:hypothetical protein